MAGRLLSRAARILFAVSIPLFLISCGPKEEAQEPSPPEAPKAEAPPPPERPAEVAPKVEMQEGIERNPFLSHIVIAKGAEEKVRKGPLECCELNAFKVVAVAVNPQGSFALVEAPDNKRYVVKKGDIMGTREGRIVSVDTKGITVREYVKDGKGRVISTLDTELKLPEKGFGIRR